jgi:hypothetical protein
MMLLKFIQQTALKVEISLYQSNYAPNHLFLYFICNIDTYFP